MATKNIPVALYHITDLKNVKGIKARGLLPHGEGVWLFGSRSRADDVWGNYREEVMV